MKILLTTDTIGGVWTFSMELVAALEHYGIEVAIATLGRGMTADQQRDAAQLENATLYPSEFKLEWMHEPWDDVRKASHWLLQLRDTVQPDVIHLNHYAHATLPWAVPVVVAAHSCAQSWWEAVRRTPLPARWKHYRDIVAQALHAADAVVVPSRAMGQTITRLYELPHQPYIIPNGRTTSKFLPGAKHPFVLSSGRLWDEAKNLATLDKAAANLCWPVYVAGPLQHPGRFAAAPTLNARLLGMLPSMHMRQWMSRADIYALPARYEPFGLSILEAALAGCALALGDIPSLREVWDEAAVFAPPDDADTLRHELTALIKTPQERLRLASLSRTRALQFTAERMARAYADIYNRVLAASPRPVAKDQPQCDAVNAAI